MRGKKKFSSHIQSIREIYGYDHSCVDNNGEKMRIEVGGGRVNE